MNMSIFDWLIVPLDPRKFKTNIVVWRLSEPIELLINVF